jgi:hypothetical protein
MFTFLHHSFGHTGTRHITLVNYPQIKIAAIVATIPTSSPASDTRRTEAADGVTIASGAVEFSTINTWHSTLNQHLFTTFFRKTHLARRIRTDKHPTEPIKRQSNRSYTPVRAARHIGSTDDCFVAFPRVAGGCWCAV